MNEEPEKFTIAYVGGAKEVQKWRPIRYPAYDTEWIVDTSKPMDFFTRGRGLQFRDHQELVGLNRGKDLPETNLDSPHLLFPQSETFNSMVPAIAKCIGKKVGLKFSPRPIPMVDPKKSSIHFLCDAIQIDIFECSKAMRSRVKQNAVFTLSVSGRKEIECMMTSFGAKGDPLKYLLSRRPLAIRLCAPISCSISFRSGFKVKRPFKVTVILNGTRYSPL